jgi:hypothetical protein
MSKQRRASGRALAALTPLAFAYLALLAYPRPLFAHSHHGAFIVLRSDEPIPTEAGHVLALAEAKVRRSPLFEPAREYDVYLCANHWRWWLLSGGNTRSGAVTLPVTGSVIVRAAHVARNRAVQASGQEAPGERTLDYLIAHEVTHAMTGRFLGVLAMRRLPAWAREGYADYVGRGAGFDYEDARRALVGGDRGPLHAQSGQYLRYTLLVARLLDREGWSVETLLRAPPDPRAVEARVRSGS